MAYYFSYILNDDGGRMKKSGITFPRGLYHSSIALTEHNPPEPPTIITKIGLFDSSQVEQEDFLKPKAGRKFYHKTYPITREQVGMLMIKINEDRRIGVPEKLAVERSKLSSDYVITIAGEEMRSIPGGPKYSFKPSLSKNFFFGLNCKTYAMSLLKTLGIRDKTLESWIYDDPGTGREYMQPLEFIVEPDGKLVWESPLQFSEQFNLTQLKNLTEDEREDMLVSLQRNEVRGFLHDALRGLKQAITEQIPGIEQLLNAFNEIYREMQQFEYDKAQFMQILEKIIKDKPNLQLSDIKQPFFGDNFSGFEEYLKDKGIDQNKNLKLPLMDFMNKKNNIMFQEKHSLWLKNMNLAVNKLEHSASINSKDYGIIKYIVDSLKNALNYLGAEFKLSDRYKQKKFFTKLKEHVGKVDLAHEKIKTSSKKKPAGPHQNKPKTEKT